MRQIALLVSLTALTLSCATEAEKKKMAALNSSCLKIQQKHRACTDDFIPALVELRVKLGKPAKIVELDQSMGRDALVEAAKAEWKVDSTDERLADTCENGVDDLPREKLDEFQNLADRCLEIDACQEFVTCTLPIIEQTL